APPARRPLPYTPLFRSCAWTTPPPTPHGTRSARPRRGQKLAKRTTSAGGSRPPICNDVTTPWVRMGVRIGNGPQAEGRARRESSSEEHTSELQSRERLV